MQFRCLGAVRHKLAQPSTMPWALLLLDTLLPALHSVSLTRVRIPFSPSANPAPGPLGTSQDPGKGCRFPICFIVAPLCDPACIFRALQYAPFGLSQSLTPCRHSSFELCRVEWTSSVALEIREAVDGGRSRKSVGTGSSMKACAAPHGKQPRLPLLSDCFNLSGRKKERTSQILGHFD